jgi:hypothetical protein
MEPALEPNEQVRVCITLKEGTLWTQIFYKGEIVSSYISNDEYEALEKAKKFYKAYPQYLIINPARKW